MSSVVDETLMVPATRQVWPFTLRLPFEIRKMEEMRQSAKSKESAEICYGDSDFNSPRISLAPRYPARVPTAV